MNDPDVYIAKIGKAVYPDTPFDPPEFYPEFSKTELIDHIDETNEVYSTVRLILYNLGFDKENFGTENWNPFKTLVSSGDKIILKPNFVKGNHPLGINGVLSMISHASIMRPIIDYLLLAIGTDADIAIADVPLQSSSWEEIITKSGAKSLVNHYKSLHIDIKLLDLRKEIAVFNNENVIKQKIPNPERKAGKYIAVDLGKNSALYEINQYSKKLEITDYGYGTVSKHHNADINEYLLPMEILEADCIINLPKMKTHRKAGITCAMKNLIGINGDKSWIAHHRRGLKENGGDEFEKFIPKVVFRERLWNFLKSNRIGIFLATLLKKFFRVFIWHGKTYEENSMHSETDQYREGSWHGNDTIWRCIKDLNQILFYADKNGKMQRTQQRKYLCFVDGILSGEKEGPMEHLPKETGLIVGGKNPVEIDYTVSQIMGFDFQLIPSVRNSFGLSKYSLTKNKADDIKIAANCSENDYKYYFKTPSGWKNIYKSINKKHIL